MLSSSSQTDDATKRGHEWLKVLAYSDCDLHAVIAKVAASHLSKFSQEEGWA